MMEAPLHGADGAADGTIADRLAIQRGCDLGNERIAIGRVQGSGSVGYGKELRLAERDRHGHPHRACATPAPGITVTRLNGVLLRGASQPTGCGAFCSSVLACGTIALEPV